MMTYILWIGVTALVAAALYLPIAFLAAAVGGEY